MTTMRTGISGVDQVLSDGIAVGSTVVIEGNPGTGKTTFGLQFLYEGAAQFAEAGMYITFEEFPQQIEHQGERFGWPLKALAERNLLRIVGIRPELFEREMDAPDGILDTMVHELKCKRMVIDSVNLFEPMQPTQQAYRNLLYRLRNICRKHGVTLFLIREGNTLWTDEAPFEHFVADGVIRLRYQPFLELYRERTFEVIKLRGSDFVPGEHVFRLSKLGFQLLPALGVSQTFVPMSEPSRSVTTTGFSLLDDILGGIETGRTYLFHIDSLAYSRPILRIIMAERLRRGDVAAVQLSSAITLNEFATALEHLGLDVDELVRSRSLLFIEHYQRPVPRGFEEVILDAGDGTYVDWLDRVRSTYYEQCSASVQSGRDIIVVFDLNTLIGRYGRDIVMNNYPRVIMMLKGLGATTCILADLAELGSEAQALVERKTDGVIRVWSDGRNHYVKVDKSPSGRISSPLLLTSMNSPPYLALY